MGVERSDRGPVAPSAASRIAKRRGGLLFFLATSLDATVDTYMRRWARKLVVVLATGYILFFYSERMFWSFLRPGDTLTDLLLTWVVYSLLAWVFLLLVRQSEEDRAVLCCRGVGLGIVGRVVAGRAGQSRHVAGGLRRAHGCRVRPGACRVVCVGQGGIGVVSTRPV